MGSIYFGTKHGLIEKVCVHGDFFLSTTPPPPLGVGLKKSAGGAGGVGRGAREELNIKAFVQRTCLQKGGKYNARWEASPAHTVRIINRAELPCT